MKKRIEKDSLGPLEVPEDAYYGVQTARALENFPVSGIRPHPEFVHAFVLIKKAAARVNRDLGMLDARRAEAILKACDEVLDGRLLDQFVVDVYQAGAGTSHNMNTNEVLANRAIELLGGARGDYSVIHPNDHVNMAQSTNDTIPAAIRIAARLLQRRLDSALEELALALEQKAQEFDALPTSARTHLQDAVPMRLGQQFGGYAVTVNRCREKLQEAALHLEELNLGSTAAGTGMNSHPEYAARVAQELAQLTGLPLRPARSFFDVGGSLGDMAHYSGALRTLALELTKLANDLRLYASGPNTGLDEFRLPPVQPGSSIMPGKVNPVMAECLNMICYQVLGNDTAVAYAAQAGQFQLNVMMPLVAYNLLHAQKILAAFLPHFARRCVAGIEANPERCRLYFERSLGIATALNPIIGYSQAAKVVQQALREGKSVFQVIEETGLMTAEEIQAKFDPRRLTEPGLLKR